MRKTKLPIRKLTECRCGTAILVNHPYSWCTHCGERLLEETLEDLPQLDTYRTLQKLKLVEDPVLSIPVGKIITKLRDRAEGLRTFAGFTMCGMVFLVMVGIGIFLNAGNTAQQETSPALKDLSIAIQTLQGIKDSVDKGTPLPPGDDKTTIETAIKNSQSAIIQSTDRLRQDLAFTKVVLPVLISSTTQRVGIIVLLIFLLQILVPTYRYNHRLAAYYSARADALEILFISDNKLSDNKLDTLVAILSPDLVDFGKTVKSPADHALEAIKETMKAAGQSAVKAR